MVIQQPAEVFECVKRDWMPAAKGPARHLQSLAQQRLRLVELALEMQLHTKRSAAPHKLHLVLAIRAIGLEPCAQKLDAQRVAVLVHALAAAVGCVLLWARAPPLLEAVFVDPLGGAAAGARLHERAVLLTLKAHPAPLLLLARSILAGSSTGEGELHRKTRRGGARSHSDRGLHDDDGTTRASKFGGVLLELVPPLYSTPTPRWGIACSEAYLSAVRVRDVEHW